MRAKAILKTSLIVIVVVAGCAGRRPTGLSMVTKSNPPVFKLSGNSYFLSVTVTAFPGLNELQNDTGKYVSIWEINTKTTADSHTPIEKLPTISYGTVPPGFAQFRPYGAQPRPPLEEGKFYKVEASATHGKSDGRGGWEWERSNVCFAVTASTIAEVPCK